MSNRMQFHNLERIDAGDLTLVSDLLKESQDQAIRSTVGAGLGNDTVIRGYLVTVDDPPAMTLIAWEGSAIVGGVLAVREGATVLNIAPAHPSQPRIDLVSLKVTDVDHAEEARTFLNESSEEEYQQNVPTRRNVLVEYVVTPGTPGANPVAPPTPGGQLAIWTVRVDAAATTIAASKLSRVGAPPIVGSDRLVQTSFPGVGAGPIGLTVTPYLTSVIGGQITLPPASLNLVVAQIYLGAIPNLAALDFQIVPVGGGTPIGRVRRGIASASNEETMIIFGIRIGGATAQAYEVRIANNGGATNQHAAITLPTAYIGSGGVVSNVLAAVSV